MIRRTTLRGSAAAALALSLSLAGQSAAQLFTGNNGRIAYTTDGNIHDRDDFGATPVSLAILARRGLQDKLVHYDYNNHIGESTSNGERQMTTSALGSQDRFGFRRNVFFDDIQDLSGSIENFKNAINASSANDRLFVILGGPSEVLWRALNAADADKRRFVTVVSHSFFNEFHANDAHTGQPNHGRPNHNQLRRTITDVQNLGATFMRIDNQNDFWNTDQGGRGGFGALDWMENHPNANMRWVYTRIQAAGKADYSDAGMVYFLITGDDNANVNTQRNFFTGTFPPSSVGNGGGNTGGSGNFIESNGLLIMEAESATLPADWNTVTSVPNNDPTMAGFTGDGYIEWTGQQFFGNSIPAGNGTGIINYDFTITTPGTYSLRWRSKQRGGSGAADSGNDSFVRFATGTQPSNVSDDFSRFTKVFIQNRNTWDLNFRAEPSHAEFRINAFRRTFTAGNHRIQLAARSPQHAIDRLILHRNNVPFNANRFATTPESPREGGGNGGGGNGGGGNGGGDGTPFGGTPRQIPGLIQAEDFNAGGEDVAYNDVDPGNNGTVTYRSGENVDLENRTGNANGRNVGWIQNGEFLKYTTNVSAGIYNIEARVASARPNPGNIQVRLDDADLGTFPVASTGGWDNWEVLRLDNVTIAGGNNETLRLNFVAGGDFNLDWVRFTRVAGAPQTVNIRPNNDTFLQNGTRIGGNLLRIQPNGPTRESYLKFNVRGVSGDVTDAKLQLTVTDDAGNGTVSVYRGATNSWNENNLTASNAPARGALLGTTSGTFGIGNLVEIDLGSGITGNGVISLIVVLNNGGNDIAFSSKEGRTAATLEITSQ